MKPCSTCNTIKPLTDFHKRNGTRDNHQASCKSCKSNYGKRTGWGNKSPKICGDCGIEVFRRNTSKIDKKIRCKKCGTKFRRKYQTEWMKTWYKNNTEQAKALKRKYTFNLSESEYQLLVQTQKGRCKICYSDGKLHIDHCHSTGRVRGLLCHKCNVMLGMAQDDEKILLEAIEYLKKQEGI
jgi:DNA-directed RNA polymerase subunit RPC12/RpoP